MDSDDDVCIVKVTSTKSQAKRATWVTPSFDDFGPATASIPSSSSSFSSSSSSSSFRTRPPSQPPPRKTVQSKLSDSLLSAKSFPEPVTSLSRKRHRGDKRLPAHKLVSAVQSDTRGHKLKSAASLELWADKHQPKKKEDLAVHKKKVEDIGAWLRDRTKSFPKHSAPVLLVTGPPGAGKTAAIKTLVAELRLQLQEWSSADTYGGQSDWRASDQQDWAERSSVDVYTSQSQSSQFSNFLLRANKYQALSLTSTPGHSSSSQGRVILVEEFPNAFYRDPSELHNIVRKYRHSGHCPVVFVVSDASSSSSNVQRLFPPALQEELSLESVSVNPVAPTMMVKVLNKIASVEAAQGHFSVPSAGVVESIAMSSAGDVRSAINALQFACRQDTVDLSRLGTATQRRPRKESSGSGRRLKYGSLAKQDSGSASSPHTSPVIGSKDTTCFLFHALGKILYFKRGEPADSCGQRTLPAHLTHHHRDPLLLTPEEVVDKTHLSGDYFNTFLHQNYLHFLQGVGDVDRAAGYLSDADILSAQYSSRGQLQDYSVSVATRGFIHSESSICRHTDSRKGHGWRPLHKSQWFSTQKQCQDSKAAAMRLFRGYHWDPEVLLTEVVPYINLTNPTLHDPGQISFVQSLCQYSRSSYALRSGGLEKIEEKSAVDDEENDDSENPTPTQQFSSLPATGQAAWSGPATLTATDGDEESGLPSSQPTVKTTVAELEEEECVIEEFDD